MFSLLEALCFGAPLLIRIWGVAFQGVGLGFRLSLSPGALVCFSVS